MIDVFRYEGLRSFLGAHVEAKKAENPNFTLGVWARLLGIENKGSLSRLVSGDRLPGEKLAAALERYFDFDDGGLRYFRLLIQLEKLRNDPVVRAELLARLAEMRRQRAEAPPFRMAIEMVCLWGTVAADNVRALLHTSGLEPDTMVGRTVVVIKAANNTATELGPYSEFNIAMRVRRPERVHSEIAMFFTGLFSTSDQAIATWRQRWRVQYERADMIVRLDERESVAELVQNEACLVRMQMGPSEIPLETRRDDTEFAGYSGEAAHEMKYRIVNRLVGMNRGFDPTVDRFELPTESSVSRLLGSSDFAPLGWSLYLDYDADVYSPTLDV